MSPAISQTPKRVLIVLMGAIGDVVRGLPLAMRLKQYWPETEISWAVEPISSSLVFGHPGIDRVVVFNRPEGLAGYIKFIHELRSQPYDLVIDLQRHFKSGVTSFLSGAPLRLGYDRGNSREFNWLFHNRLVGSQERYSPKILQFQKFADELGLPATDNLDFGLTPTESETKKVAALMHPVPDQARASSRRFVALILGSTWESRLWFPEKYRELIGELNRTKGLVSVLVGGSREREFADQILSGLSNQLVLDLIGKTSLRDLVAVFKSCEFAIGSDSGPMHIAAAAGIPVVSLWGATSPKRSGPWGSEKYVLQSAIGCSPCYRKQCPGLGRLCMSSITTNAVMAQVGRVDEDIQIPQSSRN